MQKTTPLIFVSGVHLWLGAWFDAYDVCNTGDEAFIYAINQDNDYDLAIVDRMLPVIDGLSIIKAIRQKGIQIPIIIITGMSELEDKIEGLDSGADDYLIKPFHIKELSARIRALSFTISLPL